MAKKKTTIQKKATKKKIPKDTKKKAFPMHELIDPKGLVSDLKKMKNPAEYVKLILYIALPSVHRLKITGASTQQELAKEFGVDMSTLSEWKNRPGFWEDVRNVTNQWFIEDAGDIIFAQKVQALKGDTPAAKLVLDTIGYTKKDEKENDVPKLLAEAIKNISAILDK